MVLLNIKFILCFCQTIDVNCLTIIFTHITTSVSQRVFSTHICASNLVCHWVSSCIWVCTTHRVCATHCIWVSSHSVRVLRHTATHSIWVLRHTASHWVSTTAHHWVLTTHCIWVLILVFASFLQVFLWK